MGISSFKTGLMKRSFLAGNYAYIPSVRGLFAGGANGGNSNVIDYINILSAGNATDFGDLTFSVNGLGGASSTVRGLFGGGGSQNAIDYVTIASTGNGTDFGDLTQNTAYGASCSNAHGGLS